MRWETVPLGCSVKSGIDKGNVRRNQFQDKPLSGSKRNDTSVSKRRTNSFSKLFPVLCLVERRGASTLSTPLLEICLKVLFYCNFLKIKPVIIISYTQSVGHVLCIWLGTGRRIPTYTLWGLGEQQQPPSSLGVVEGNAPEGHSDFSGQIPSSCLARLDL